VLALLKEPLSHALDCLTRKLTLPLAVGVSLAKAKLH
jgi:hypothetical protein